MNQRIQIIRAMAIVAVVAIHTPPPQSCLFFFRLLVNPAVAVFLFLSAFLSAQSYTSKQETAPAFITKRLRRMVPPYVLWCFICALPWLFETGSIKTYFLSAYGQTWGVPYYFLLVYLQLTLLFPLLFCLAQSKYHLAGWLITPATYILVYAAQARGMSFPGSPLHHYGLNGILNGCFFPLWVAVYYLGIMLGNGRLNCTWSKARLSALYLLILLLQAAEGWAWYQCGNLHMALTPDKLSSCLTSLAACLLCSAYFCSDKPIPTKPHKAFTILLLIGNCSMGIFMCHCLILRMWQGFLPVFYQSNPFPVNTVLVLMSSLLLILLANRTLPASCTKLFGIHYRKTAS